ncbi:MAG: ABC transporter ATP-binding protein [Gammaproteobacteria bacterium]
MTPPNIIIRNLSLAYGGVALFADLNLTLRASQCTCLLGPSGVGKSTLLRLIANLISPNTSYRGEILADNPEPLASQVSYMAQTDLLLPWLTTLDNVLLSSRLCGKDLSSLRSQAKDLLSQVGLTDALDKYPHELSGGMRQRAALIRTLIQDKPIVLMDEPFSAVDAITRLELQTLAAKLLTNRTVFLVTHDPIEALRLANEVVILSGQPAKLTSLMSLSSATPRDPSDPEFIKHQTDLFHALRQAKEMSW